MFGGELNACVCVFVGYDLHTYTDYKPVKSAEAGKYG